MFSIREKLANFFSRRKMLKAFCFVRGQHVGLAQTGLCLACGKGQRRVSERTRPIIHRLELQRSETPKERANRIRKQAREFGL